MTWKPDVCIYHFPCDDGFASAWIARMRWPDLVMAPTNYGQPFPDVDLPSNERHLAALRAKAFAGRLATVGDTAIQVFGGIGYTWEHDAHLYLKRLLSWSALLGGPDRYLTELGARLTNRGPR